MTTAFVLSGGANLGAVQVGMLRALDEAGIRPDLLVGASAGAINAAWYAGRPARDGVDGLAQIWRSLRRRDVFPMRFGFGLVGFVGQRTSLFSSDGLRRLLAAHLSFSRLEDAPIPLHVVVTDVLDGIDHAVSVGSAIDAIIASASIPGVFPPVDIAGRACMDGGVVNNAPVSHAVALGADVVYVIPDRLRVLPVGDTPVGVGDDPARTRPDGEPPAVDRHRPLPAHGRPPGGAPPCPIAVGPGDFSQADPLMARAYDTTRAWLHAAPLSRAANPVREHRHGRGDGPTPERSRRSP